MAKPFLCIGHRGAAGYEPENTLASIRRALEMGAAGIEIDVQLSLDGQLVVIHDSTLRRTTGTRGRVARKTLAELKQLDAGNRQHIPTLAEVLELIAGRALLNIELKAPGTALPVQQAIVGAVRAGGTSPHSTQSPAWTFEKLLVSSFDHKELALVTAPEIRIGALVGRRPLSIAKLAQRLRASSIHIPLRIAGEKLIRRIHAESLRAYVYTVNEPADIQHMREMGVDGIFTDYPDRVERQ